MKYTLILVEKNSLAREIIKTLQLIEKEPNIKANSSTLFFYKNSSSTKNFIILSSGGHLFETKKLDFNQIKINDIPILQTPEIELIKEKKKTFSALKKNISNINETYHFGDCGQEGQIIQDTIIKELNINPSQVKRAWFSEITQKELNNAYKNAKSNTEPFFYNLGQAGCTRQMIDYWIGMNYSFLTNEAIGRVKTPIVFHIYERCFNYDNHIKSPFWYLLGTTCINQNKINLKSKNQKNNIFENIEIKQETQLKCTTKEKELTPQKLLNLNDLQAIVKNHSPKKTLEIAQKLYEQGLITYPRTNENKLIPSTETIESIKKIYKYHFPNENYKELLSINIKNKKTFLNTKETPDHTAIIPTEKSCNTHSLEKNEKQIFEIIKNRFIVHFSKNAKIKQLEITTTIKHEENNYELKTDIKSIITEGFLFFKDKKGYQNLENLEDENLEDIKETKNKKKYQTLENLEAIKKTIEKQKIFNLDLKNIQEFTKPEPLFTEQSIIQWLDKKNIGTTATRSNILQQCIDKNYIEVNTKKKLVITDKGKEYYQKLKDTKCKELALPKFTSEMETNLKQIRENKQKANDYKNQIIEIIKETSNELKKQHQENSAQNTIQTKLNCPICKKELNNHTNKNYYKCPDKNNHFFLSKIFLGTNIEKYFEILLKEKQTEKIDFTSKNNKSFSASINLIQENEKYRININFENKETETNISCPTCKNNLIKTKFQTKCNDCQYSLPIVFSQVNIETEHQKLINGEKIEKNLISKKNKNYTAFLNFDKKENKIIMNFKK